MKLPKWQTHEGLRVRSWSGSLTTIFDKCPSITWSGSLTTIFDKCPSITWSGSLTTILKLFHFLTGIYLDTDSVIILWMTDDRCPSIVILSVFLLLCRNIHWYTNNDNCEIAEMADARRFTRFVREVAHWQQFLINVRLL